MADKNSPIISQAADDDAAAQPIIVGRKLAENPSLPQNQEDGTELVKDSATKPDSEEVSIPTTIPSLQPSEELKAELETAEPARPVTPPVSPTGVSEITLPGSETATVKSDDKSKEGGTKEVPAYDEKTAKLIEDKTYFLPIQQTGHRRSLKLLTILVAGLLLVGFVGFYLAADAGIVHAGFTPPTNLIPDK